MLVPGWRGSVGWARVTPTDYWEGKADPREDEASQSRQKSYADKRRKFLKFAVGEHVFLRVSPTKGVGRAIKSRKLTPKFVGPYQILKRVGPVTYEVALPP